MKALIVGNADSKVDTIAAAQLNPFFSYRKALQRQLGLTFKHIQAVSLEEIEQACKAIDLTFDILFIRPDWRENSEAIVDMVAAIRAAHIDLKILFIDPWDQVSSRFFGVLPYVDRMLKYQCLKDVQQYAQSLHGGTVITDYLVKECGYDLGDWHVGSKIPAGYEHRIDAAWNVVTAKRFERVLTKSLLWRLQHNQLRRFQKDIDVFCHVSYDSIHTSNWYTSYRKMAVKAVEALDNKYQLAVSGEHPEKRTVSTKQYMNEIERSRIVVAPFGWGETTWRDYEAICHNCLLLKPSIDHISTTPNIYHPFQTYVPLQWDFSDLEEKCDYYLHNPDEAAQIITNARRVLERYYQKSEFVNTIGRLIAGEPANLPAGSQPAAQIITSPVA